MASFYTNIIASKSSISNINRQRGRLIACLSDTRECEGRTHHGLPSGSRGTANSIKVGSLHCDDAHTRGQIAGKSKDAT